MRTLLLLCALGVAACDVPTEEDSAGVPVDEAAPDEPSPEEASANDVPVINEVVAAGALVTSGIALGPDGVPHLLLQIGDDRMDLARRTSAGWTRETLPFPCNTDDERQGYYPQAERTHLAIDGNGHAHVVCNRCESVLFPGSSVRQNACSLVYATNASGVWRDEVAVAAQPWRENGLVGVLHRGKPSEIAVDGQGRVHLAFFDRYVRDSGGAGPVFLAYQRGRAGQWEAPRRIDELRSAADMLALALDAGGAPHILSHWSSFARQGLHDHTPGANATWKQSTLADVSSDLLVPSLAVDAEGIRHVAYYDTTLYDGHRGVGILFYTVAGPNEDRAWSAPIDGDGYGDDHGDSGGDPSIAIGPDGRVHIAYYSNARDALKHAVSTPDGGWVMRYIDTGGVGWDSSIAVDATGRVHIAHYDHRRTRVKYSSLMP